MSFPDAIRKVINGKSITRLAWKPANDYCLLKDGWLTVCRNGVFHRWLVNDGDLEGTDWIVIGEVN